jgi:hypothetical protein
VTQQGDEPQDYSWLDEIREPANPLPLLQKWYLKQCDADWEHSFGIRISTLDNPGWRVEIDIAETRLDGQQFERYEENRGEQDWMHCWLKKTTWHGAGDPKKLNVILLKFLDWAADAAPMWPNSER